MTKRVLALLLLLCCLCAAALADWSEEDDFYTTALKMDGQEISPWALAQALRFDLFDAAARCANLGYDYSIVEADNILDTLDKLIFDLEYDHVVRREAETMGLAELTEEEEQRARQLAREQWDFYLSVMRSENGLAYLPAGFHTPVEGDSEENTRRYLASFGVTVEALESRARMEIIHEKVRALFPAGDDAEEDAYTEWLMGALDEAVFELDGFGIAEACLRLWPE